MILTLSRCSLRPWRPEDAVSVARHAANPKIASQMADGFAALGELDGARRFIESARARDPESYFAIEVAGEAAGGIGFVLGKDYERVSAQIAYWLGEPFWGRGIASEALSALSRYALEKHALTRVWAAPFATNAASCRVLEKAGFALEARLRRSAIKGGEVLDQALYALVP